MNCPFRGKPPVALASSVSDRSLVVDPAGLARVRAVLADLMVPHPCEPVLDRHANRVVRAYLGGEEE